MELKIFSKRAESILAKPVHALSETAIIPNHQKWIWEFALEERTHKFFQNDKILTLLYFNQHGTRQDLLILETLSQMCIKREIQFLQKLTFRELENFLRDENHLAVFKNSEVDSPEESFKRVKNSLLVAILSSEIKKIEKNGLHLKHWSQLTLVEKNLISRNLVLSLNSLFSEAKPLELALATATEIALVMNEFPIGHEVIEWLARELFGIQEGETSLKVVAVQ